MKYSFLNFKGIRLKLTLYLALTVILITLCISIVIVTVFSDEISKQRNIIVTHKMSILTRELDEEILLLRSFISSLSKDVSIQNQFKSKSHNPYDNILLGQKLYSYSSKNNSIISIIPISLDQHILDPVYSLESFQELLKKNIDFEKFIEKGYFGRFSLPHNFPVHVEKQKNKSSITYFHNLLDDNYTSIGYLLVNLKIPSFFYDINIKKDNFFDAIFVIDSHKNIIYRSEGIEFTDSISLSDLNTKSSYNTLLSQNNKEYHVYSKKLDSYKDWMIVGIISDVNAKNSLKIIFQSLFFLGIFFLFVIIFFSLSITKSISRPINEISKSIEVFEKGEWPKEINIDTEEEFKYLIYDFNRLFINVKKLIHKIKKDERFQKEMEVKYLQSQLQLLQSQINPHFIHNTLNTVTYLSIKHQADDIRNLIQSFNKLLRMSISNDKVFITLKEELDIVLNYINIQHYRYDSKINFSYNLPEELFDYKIPKLILQPLVENSIYHGILPKQSDGRIHINFEPKAEEIIISVIDDGVGLVKENNHLLEEMMEVSTKTGFNSIGLKNINERLYLYFGEEYSLSIENLSEGGCKVTFSIPYFI